MLATNVVPIASKQTDTSGHVIGSITGLNKGPSLIVIGSIHGNEPAGAEAARRILPALQKKRWLLAGEVIFLSGNTRALAKGVRYIDSDLNRLWTQESVDRLRAGDRFTQTKSEEREVGELLEQFDQVAERATSDIYYLDLHTTSAHGEHFATVGDTMRNRRFAMNFPTTIVLGLEEQIEGTMNGYLNNLGAVTMGFEAGQHEALVSVEHDVAVIWIALVAAGLLCREDTPEFARSLDILKARSDGVRIVEVRHRHAISPDDEFKMEPAFKNFQAVKRGQILARDHNGPVKAIESGMVLLPLYQKLGDDGFFLSRAVKPLWLKLSALLRRLKVGDYVHLLPGVRRQTPDGSSFIVNTRIARILPLQVFHLLGFRKLRWTESVLIVTRRRYDLAGPKKSGSKEIQT